LIYALQFLWVANLKLHGAALVALPLLYGADVFVAFSDVWEETKSRRSLGGLPRGEYLMHIVLSVLVGIYLCCVASAVWPDRALAAEVVLAPPAVPGVLRAVMTLMAAGAFVAFAHDLSKWFAFRRRPLELVR